VTWAQVLVMQGGAFTLLLSIVGALARVIIKGTLVPRSTVDDVRKDRDERVAAAERQAAEWRKLWESEHGAHDTTRAAYGDEIRAALLASSEGAQIGVELLREIRTRQIEASRDPAA
jgi:hypothetical protein